MQAMPKRAIEAVSLYDRIVGILGDSTMNIAEILQALEDAGDPRSRAAVNQVLSKSFERASRGRYRVAKESDQQLEIPSTAAAVTEEVSPVIEHNEPSNGNANGTAKSYAKSSRRNLQNLPPNAEDCVELRNLIAAYGTLNVRALLDKIEQPND